MSKRINKQSSPLNGVVLCLSFFIIVFSLAAVVAYEIVTTTTEPALPGVFYATPQPIVTKYCFAENTVLELCIER